MPSKDIGQLRRSSVIGTFGPGAVVDFRADKAAISAVAGGLEEWDRNFWPAGLSNKQTIQEERLQKKLNVKGFRLPPVRDPLRNEDEENKRALVAVRFPQWQQCPKCDQIGPAGKWEEKAANGGLYCQPCTQKAPGKREVWVVPVRFITACEHGHLDEFPWHWWVQHLEGCANKNGKLKLTAEGAGLAGLILSCEKCKKRRSLDGIFSGKRSDGQGSVLPKCQGYRPWLADGTEVCRAPDTIRTMQRGASNLYFPVIESALSIPPWSDYLQEALGQFWEAILNVLPEDRAAFIRILAQTTGSLGDVLKELHLSPAQLHAEIERRLSAHEEIDVENLRVEEYRQLTAVAYDKRGGADFEVRPEAVPADLRRWISRVVKAVRLREVRAMTGFTRIQPPSGDADSPAIASLSLNRLDWLPAIEVRGEGILIDLDEARVRIWENDEHVKDRASIIDDAWTAEWQSHNGTDTPKPRIITPRFLLLHTFAHAVMRQLTLDCGYSSTALRERLYVGGDTTPMSGVLIYTSATDDDGTLGGLQRQGDTRRIQRTITAAVQAQAWCSSDPLCIEDMMAPADHTSLAACHACVLAPETSCEEFNRFLDRAMLVGKPEAPGIGFFAGLLRTDIA